MVTPDYSLDVDYVTDLDAAGLMDQVLDETFPLWGDGLDRRAYGLWNQAQRRTRWGRDRLTRVGLVDSGRGAVLASAKRYLFDAVLDGAHVPVLGLGAVFTAADQRGRGLAPKLVDRMVADAAERGCRLALLFSEIGEDYYARLGFSAVPRRMWTLTVPPTDRGAPATMVRTADPTDLPEMAALSMSGAATTGAQFAIVRSPEWLDFAVTRRRLCAGFGPDGMRQVEVLVAEEGYRVAAYIVVSRGPGGVVLEDCADRDPSGARIGALLEALVERDPSQPDRSLRAWLPEGLRPPQLHVEDAGAASDIMMFRAISGDAAVPTDVVYWPLDVF